MENNDWNIANADVAEVILEVPDGHRHLRTTFRLRDGRTITFQEATIANVARAYTTLKTHPARTALRLRGTALSERERKPGFAEWQLLEVED